MFKKLLANLPFNPSLIDQVSFYHGRLRKETAIRRLGFIMMALALMIQFAAALYPAKQSLAASPNDILNGIADKRSLLRAWDNNTNNIRGVYSKFGITRKNIADIKGQKPNATIVSNGRNYWSTGRLPLNAFGISSSKWGERRVNANGTTVYERPLRAWDTSGSSRYAAFKGKNIHGKTFWILQTCGNPTFIGPYLPSPPKPKLTVHKTLLTSNVVRRGDIVRFRLEYQNTKPDSLATNFKLKDTINRNFEFISLNGLSSRSGNTLTISRNGELGYTSTPYVSTLVLRVKSNASNQARLCNQAKVTSKESSDTSEKPCVTVVVPKATSPPPQNPPPPAPPSPTPSPSPSPPASVPNPAGYCIASTSFVSGSNRDFVIRTTTQVESGTQITGYNYDVGVDGRIDHQDKTSSAIHERRFNNLPSGTHEIAVYVQLKNSEGKTAQTKACQSQIVIAEDARVNLSKSVKNLTSNDNDANGTTIKSGDILEFTLVTKNVTATDYRNYNGEDYFGSVLQYADIIDNSQLTKQGMSLDDQNYLRWDLANLKGGSTDTKTIQVKVKDIIPLTNSPSKLSPDYNCTISNNYGNEITMNVDCPIIKSIDQTATSLPNTGPGTTITIGAIIAIAAGYFFSRSRILARELAIVKNEYTSSGGF